MALHFSEATPVDTKTIYQQQGGRGRWGPQDFSVTERRAVRQVIPSNKRGKKTERKRRGGKMWWQSWWRVSQPQRRLLRPWNQGQWLELRLESFIPTCVRKLSKDWAVLLLDEPCAVCEVETCRDRERRSECSSEEDMAEWSDRPGDGGRELQEKTSSLVTKAAGLRSTVPALSLSFGWSQLMYSNSS